MSSDYFKAIGAIRGTLNLDTKLLTASKDGQSLEMSYNRKFENWLKSLDSREKEQLQSAEYTYVALPRTLLEAPFLSYTIIGLDKDSKDKRDASSVNGICVYENCQYGFSLLKVNKDGQNSFIVKVYGELPNPRQGIGRFFAVKAEREDVRLVIKTIELCDGFKVAKGRPQAL
jgi:hypothetical protein